jgi:hypothetical protein
VRQADSNEPLKVRGVEGTAKLDEFWRVASRPLAIKITSGKKAIRNAASTREISPAPTRTTMMGAMAALGIDWVRTRSGQIEFVRSGDEAIASAGVKKDEADRP